jgi:hypothetical protein
MGNQTPRVYDDIIELLADGAYGAALHALVILLLQNPAAAILATRALLVGTPAGPGGVPPAVIGLKEKWNTAKANKVAAAVAYRAKLSAGRDLGMACINSLKNALGRQWNSQWNAVGLTNASLEIPKNPSAMLEQLGNYYASNPGKEVTGVNGVDCTAAACFAAAKAINDAQAASNAANGAAVLAKTALDDGLDAGRNRLIGLRNELSQLIADDDPRWLDYGFQMPANQSCPDVPEDLTCVNAGSGALNFRWANTQRADSYRFVLKDAADTVLVDEIVWENEYMAEKLTSGSKVSAVVSARNLTGESLPTAPVTSNVP